MITTVEFPFYSAIFWRTFWDLNIYSFASNYAHFEREIVVRIRAWSVLEFSGIPWIIWNYKKLHKIPSEFLEFLGNSNEFWNSIGKSWNEGEIIEIFHRWIFLWNSRIPSESKEFQNNSKNSIGILCKFSRNSKANFK